MKQFIMTMGAPGSGKTTWARQYVEDVHRKYGVKLAYISRDEIRFELLKEDEGYFTHEDEVLKRFFDEIEYADMDSFDEYDGIVVDATHLNPQSRHKVLSRINSENYVKIAAVFKPSVETCLEQNHLREGRARVPDQVLVSMYNGFIPPKKEEGFDFIWTKGEKEWKGVIE